MLLEDSPHILNIDFGTYPYVTSSSTMAANTATGSRPTLRSIDKVIGMYKAYITRVGSRQMPARTCSTLDVIRDRGREYGTNKGRERRSAGSMPSQGSSSRNSTALTPRVISKLDVLDTLPTIKICTAYQLHGKIIHTFRLISMTLPLANSSTKSWRAGNAILPQSVLYDGLPTAAKSYLHRLEEVLETPISMISVSRSAAKPSGQQYSGDGGTRVTFP